MTFSRFEPVHGIIFDLDGTLIDSRLDFDAIRADIGLPPGMPILEAIAAMDDVAARTTATEILHRHEMKGASEAVMIDAVPEFLEALAHRRIPTAVLTRNSRASTDAVLSRLNLKFDQVLTREDAPPKPDPTGLLTICNVWGLPPERVLFFGDYLFDLEAARRAGMRSVLFTPGTLPDYALQADLVLRSFRDALRWLKDSMIVRK